MVVNFEEYSWIPSDSPGRGRKGRLGGTYRAYVPQLLDELQPIPSRELAVRAHALEKRIRELSQTEITLILEAISSSKIEGIAPSADKIAIEELKEPDGNYQAPAKLVARNIGILREGVSKVEESGSLSVDDIAYLNSQLLGKGLGLRTVQNWIGGAGSSPLDADFVPPHHSRVPELMEDLTIYVNGALHGGLIQAAIAHAQFETIHPFEDGNGRVGRALIQMVLVQRGLLKSPSLPVSLVLGTWSRTYIDGLTAYRNGDIERWLTIFFDAVEVAIAVSNEIINDVEKIKAEWLEDIESFRKGQGKKKALRADATERRIIDFLPSMPVVTAEFVSDVLGVGYSAANTALNSLASAGVVRRKSIGRNVFGYVATDLIELLESISAPQGRAVPKI